MRRQLELAFTILAVLVGAGIQSAFAQPVPDPIPIPPICAPAVPTIAFTEAPTANNM